MPTAYIPTTITAQEGPILLFETECLAEIEYQIERGEVLTGWRISGFRYDYDRQEVDPVSGTKVMKRLASMWASQPLYELLFPYVDQTALEAQLLEWLQDRGELTPVTPAMRAAYHAGVL